MRPSLIVRSAFASSLARVALTGKNGILFPPPFSFVRRAINRIASPSRIVFFFVLNMAFSLRNREFSSCNPWTLFKTECKDNDQNQTRQISYVAATHDLLLDLLYIWLLLVVDNCQQWKLICQQRAEQHCAPFVQLCVHGGTQSQYLCNRHVRYVRWIRCNRCSLHCYQA